MKVELKDFSQDYIDALVDILMDAYQDFPEYGEPSKERAKKYINWLRNHSTLFKILFVDGEPVGFVVADANWKRIDGKRVGEIHELALKKKYWGKGLGKLLLDTAIEHLKSKNVDILGLWVGKKNASAIKLYRNYGFLPVYDYVKWLRMEKRE
ncbi:MAG: GNAT family N-acetyltransferase [Aquificae bacterium]|nr:GNAT family N-acetyltransferase [Aquificota bacterium]